MKFEAARAKLINAGSMIVSSSWLKKNDPQTLERIISSDRFRSGQYEADHLLVKITFDDLGVRYYLALDTASPQDTNARSLCEIDMWEDWEDLDPALLKAYVRVL